MKIKNKYLVTGANGCIGSWVVKQLSNDGQEIVALDQSRNKYRIELLLDQESLSNIKFVNADITDSELIKKIILEESPTYIIHLAALQVPFCKANPILGSKVNVLGTINIFEAVKEAGDIIQGLSYASSRAVYGLNRDSLPSTLYGAFKKTNELTARIYWEDYGISSVGIRPYTVYGVGRDQGLTSDPTKAILAAVLDKSYNISFSGEVGMHYTQDVARIFIEAAKSNKEDAILCNINKEIISIENFIGLINNYIPNANITYNKNLKLPFPVSVDDSTLYETLDTVPFTPLSQGIELTLSIFKDLTDNNLINVDQLNS